MYTLLVHDITEEFSTRMFMNTVIPLAANQICSRAMREYILTENVRLEHIDNYTLHSE